MEPLLIIAAGGTGGHMFPAQALAEEMLRRGWRVKLSTDIRGARYAGNFPEAVTREVVKSATTARGGMLAKLAVLPRIAMGAFKTWQSFRKDRPAVVVGFGGYPALPAMIAAWVMRLPRMVHEQNGVLGRVNKVFATRVDLVACSVWPTVLPKGAVSEHTGNPVRSAIMAKAGSPYITPGDYPMHLLVIGGSQGASILSDVVPKALGLLPRALQDRLRVSHQARDADHDTAVAAYDALGLRATVQPFFDDVPARMAESQLVISRAGASSVADLTVIGRPSILIPLAIATHDHQTANARGLVQAGGTVMVAENELTPALLATHIGEILSDPDRADFMASAALKLGRPDAAETLADAVQQLAHKGQLK